MSKPEHKQADRNQAEGYNLTKRDVAEFLNVSIFTVDRYVANRKLPHVKLNGRLVRFRRSDLVAFAEGQRVV